MKILVVEESPLTRKFIINELKTEGFSISVAATAEEALSVLETVPDIKLITLRVVMEGMDGFQFVDHLHSAEVRKRLRPLRNDRVPVVFVTSNDTDEDRLRGYQVGAADFIQKPWPKGDLVKHVNMALGQGSRFAGETVLVVDDSPTARHFITSCLAQLGVNVLEADDGETAVQILADPASQVDLVVTDLMMQRMDGDQLCVKIRGELGLTDLPVIFLSGNEDKTTILSLFKMGATDYLKKPFMKEELIARLRAYLDRESARKELVASVARLRETNLLKDEFMAVCSQDLYSPLAGILGHLEKDAARREGTDPDREQLEALVGSGRHLLSLLTNLVDISNLASGHCELEHVRQDLAGILDAALESQRHAARAKGVRLESGITSEKTAVDGDHAGLLRVCGNVISNAVKYSLPGGMVQVTLGEGRSGELVLAVCDQGVGLDPEQLPLIFDRYRRTSTPGTRGEQGTGLGLAITRELVENHGGTMAVVSSPGQGATVKIILPAAGAPPLETSAESAAAAAPQAQPTCSGRILLVDGDPGHLASGSRLLKQLGCRVTVAAGGDDAVRAFARAVAADPFDLILLDLDLPVRSAIQTAGGLRAADPRRSGDQVPILAVASRSLDGQLGRLLAAGVNDFLTRPLTGPAVREALERWLPVPV